MNNLVQSGNIQFGYWSTSKVSSCWGISTALLSAPGNACKKRTISFRDSASARILSLPEQLTASTWTSKYSDIKNRHLIKCINSLSLLYPLFTTSTTAMLSQRHVTFFHNQSFPHTTHASSIGNSSFGAMLHFSAMVFHFHCSQCVAHTATQPHLPEASDSNLTNICYGFDIIPIPFHLTMNADHQNRSDSISVLRHTKRSLSLTVDITVMIRQTNL